VAQRNLSWAEHHIARAEKSGATSLNLHGAGLTVLPESIWKLTTLTSLDLSDNGLITLPESIGNFTALTSLDLGGNKLTALPESIGNLTGLTSLDLGGNKLTALPGSIGNLTGLTSLDLGGTEMGVLPDWLGNLTALTNLNLRGNGLTVLPDWLGNLTGLTSLDLRGNGLTALPDWLGNLTTLTSLDLRSNGMSVLPESIGNLTALNRLVLGGNGLTALPDWLGNLTTLTSLDLRGNGMTALPDWLGNLTGLTSLVLGGNKLTALPDWLGNLTGLTSLVLGGNELAALPESIGNLTGLTSLVLGGIGLTALPESIGNLTGLTSLDLGGNELAALPEPIGNLTALNRLDLDGNELAALPESIGNLTALNRLALGGNKLTALPASIGDLTNLSRLDLDGNPLISPPPEVVAGGVETILAFLRASQRGLTRQWVGKLLVVGEGGAGKTSLVKALAGLQHDPREPTTHGMQISELSLDHPSENGIAMTLSTWDFGGQDIYHATHQFFLTDRSLFLLVWNPRAGYVQSRIRYWLDIITARAPKASILLVASHGDERRPSDLPLPDLQLAYPNIAASFTVDSGSRDGIPDLLSQVAERAARLPNMGLPWPDEWTAAAARLADGSRSHVRDAEMRQLMAEAGVRDPDEQHQLAELLHQRGAILRHDDPRHGTDLVVLQPEWLNTRISRILDSPIVATGVGLLTGADRDREWADVDPDLREHFLDMMQRYDCPTASPKLARPTRPP
jgi:internalin A